MTRSNDTLCCGGGNRAASTPASRSGRSLNSTVPGFACNVALGTRCGNFSLAMFKANTTNGGVCGLVISTSHPLVGKVSAC